MRAVAIEWKNRRVAFRGLGRLAAREIDRVTSYAVDGSEHSEARKAHRWDGRRHMLRVRKNGSHSLPTGLLKEALEVLDDLGCRYELEDCRRKPTGSIKLKWNGDFNPRDYQKMGAAGFPGRGIFRMSTRSGKTLTAGLVILRLKVPTLFVVTSQLLAWQAKRAFERYFVGEKIGLVGDQVSDPQAITVATVHTLARLRKAKDPLWSFFRTKMGLAIFDECHHLEGDEWRKVFDDIDCLYKLGLSATVFFEEDGEPDAQTVLLKAAAGPIVHEVGMAELVDEGWLLPCEIELHKIDQPERFESRWSQTLHKRCIVENPERNEKITERTRELVRDGHRAIIVANRLNHVDNLSLMLTKAKVNVATMTGGDSDKRRQAIVEALTKGEISVVVSTVLGEGADIPACSLVVNAEGGKSRARALQRMRCLTPRGGHKAEPNEAARFVDFVDLSSRYFADHSIARVAAYKAERAFTFRRFGF